MEPALGRHELNSLKEKWVFPSYTFIVENKKTEMHIILSLALRLKLSTCELRIYIISRKAHCSVADPMLSGFASFLWFYLQKLKVWMKKFCINKFIIMHGANVFSTTRLSRNGK